MVVVVEKVIIVSVHVRYFSFFSFFSLCQTGYIRLRRLHQVMLVYISLRQFTSEGQDVELDNLYFCKEKDQFKSRQYLDYLECCIK